MKPVVKIEPQVGTIRAYVFENENIGLPRTLFFDIRIPIAPFDYEGEVQNTSMALDFINFGVSCWREPAGSTHHFPVNPEKGYIDGSMYLEGAHNPVDVTKIRFSEVGNGLARARVTWTTDFTFEGPEELGVVRGEWDVDLRCDIEKIDAVFRSAHTQGLFESQKPWWRFW